MFHMGVSVQSPRCKSQLTTALLFPLKRNKKGHQGRNNMEKHMYNEFELQLLLGYSLGLFYPFCIFLLFPPLETYQNSSVIQSRRKKTTTQAGEPGGELKRNLDVIGIFLWFFGGFWHVLGQFWRGKIPSISTISHPFSGLFEWWHPSMSEENPLMLTQLIL